jgi:hypothetical protein
MINNETQVRLSIELQGRLGATASNSTSKRDRVKLFKAMKKGKKIVNKGYNPPEYQECKQVLTLNSECINFLVSEESRPLRIPPSTWKKANQTARLEMHLQIIADNISGCNNTKFTYEIIN